MPKLNIIQKAVSRIFNIKPDREIFHSISEEEYFKSKDANKILRKESEILRKKVGSLESQEAGRRARDLEKKEKKEEKKADNEIAKDLNKQEKEIDKNKYGRWCSLKNLFLKIYKNEADKTKFGKKFEFADKDDSVSWKFGDIILSTKGFIGVKSEEGKLLQVSSDLKGLIYKPGSIFNQVKRGRILLARDKEGNYLENFDEEEGFEDEEMSLPTFDEESKQIIFTNSTSKMNVRESYIKLMDKLKEALDRVKRLEIIIWNMKSNNEELKRSLEIYKVGSEKGKSMLSEATQSLTAINMEMTDIQKRFSNLQEKNVHLEKELSAKDEVIKRLLTEIEEVGGQTAKRKAQAEMKQVIEFFRTNMIIAKEEKTEEKPKNKILQ